MKRFFYKKKNTMRILFIIYILSVFLESFANELTNSTYDTYYEDEVGVGGMVEGSWSIGGYNSHYTYECSGITGSTDC